MPLRTGQSSFVIRENIAELIRSGRPPDQAAAIAYRKAGRARTATMDLGAGDVHIPTGVKMQKRVELISAAKRKGLAISQFALPSQRKYPIDTAARTRNAAARLEQAKKDGNVSPGDYKTARAAIARAAKSFGIQSQYNAAEQPMRRRVHIRADLADGGSLHVRHMNDRERVVSLEGVTVALADGDKRPVWIELAKQGIFKGHPAGPFELNEKVFGEIIRNFKSTENRAIPIDFEHASEADAADGTIPTMGAPAQGWIRDLKVENGRLHGLVEWGDLARGYIRSGQYKFFSPAIRFGARDRVTGEPIGAKLTSGGLTNSPYLDGLAPLAAKDEARDSTLAEMKSLAHTANEYMPQVRAALRMNELCTARECSEQLGRLRAHLDDAGGDHEMTHEGIKLGDFLLPMRALVGAQPGATWEDILDVVEDLIDAAMDRHEIIEHGGLSPDMIDEDEGALDNHDTNMTEKNTMDLTAKITELSTQLAESKSATTASEAKTAEVAVRLKDAEAKTAELSVALKEETSKREKAEIELKELRDWKEGEEKRQFDARLTEAFDSYKDERKLNEQDRDMMSVYLKSNAEGFEKRFPRVAADKRHLMRNLTDHREAGQPAAHSDEGQAPGVVVDIAAMARALSAQRHIPIGDAQRIVMQRHRKA